MDYIDAATTGTLSPHILPTVHIRKMLSHIEDTLPSTLHLPVSAKDTLHFYCYLHTHVLITNKQFLLLINVPVQDRSQQLYIYKIFTMDIPPGNFTAMISTLSTLGSHKMKPWQWKFLHNNSGFVKKQTDNFVQSLHCFNHLKTHHLALLPYMSRIQPVSLPDVPYKSGNLKMLVCPHNSPLMFGY